MFNATRQTAPQGIRPYDRPLNYASGVSPLSGDSLPLASKVGGSSEITDSLLADIAPISSALMAQKAYC